MSDREDLVAELSPIIRAEGHLSLAVPSGSDALRVFDEGIIPDVVITDLGSERSLEGIGYMKEFRRLNQLGQHLVVVEDGAPFSMQTTALASGLADATLEPLAYPFDETEVRTSIHDAMERIRRDLEGLRGEMFRETARLQQAIREAQLEMVTALALTMEAKDPYMHGHCDRVATLCGRIAEEMELDPRDADRLVSAARLHEVGKLGVSMDLLHREGPLAPEELEQVRGHAKVGAQIIGSVRSLRDMAPLVEHQYADHQDLASKLPREDPAFLLASILRVADTYDALTSTRAYRGTLARDRAISILDDGKGTKFHPGVVSVLLRMERRADSDE